MSPAPVTPNPATTPWVPVWNLNGGMDVRYNGVVYMCVRPTTNPPTAWTYPLGSAQPAVRAYGTAAQSIPNAAITPVTFAGIRWDTTSMWSSGNPTRLTVATPGKYSIVGSLAYGAAAGGRRSSLIRLNGATIIGAQNTPGSSVGVQVVAAPTIWDLQAGDYIELCAYQDSGSALALFVDPSEAPELSMSLMTGMPGPPGAMATYGVNFPTPTYDGQRHVLVDSVTNPSYQWEFRYNAGSTSAYKWEFVGGAPFHIGSSAAVNVTSDYPAFVDAAGAPSFAAPRAGDYTVWAHVNARNASAGGGAMMGVSGTGTVADPDLVYRIVENVASTTNPMVSLDMTTRLNAVPSGNQIRIMFARYPAGTGTSYFERMHMQYQPVRLA